jgi:dihydroflavonol-4-reductase
MKQSDAMIVVTGASGHIGGNLVNALVDRGRHVRALINNNDRGLIGDLDIEFAHGDVCDPASLKAAFCGAKVVYHLAGIISLDGDQGGRVQAVNVTGVRNVARAALACGVERMVHVSSVHAFVPPPDGAVLDESRPLTARPTDTAYARSKAGGERELRQVMQQGLDAVILNPTAVLGPLDVTPSSMGQFFIDLYRRKVPALIPGGYTWIDARDVAEAALAAEQKGRRGENYLLAGPRLSVVELCRVAEQITGIKSPRVIVPMWLARRAAAAQTWRDRRRGRAPLFTPESLDTLRTNPQVSSAKATRELGFQPRPIEDTVRDIYAWFRTRGQLES